MNIILKDEHGQPLNRALNKTRIEDRTATEFIGICKGLLADNILNKQETDFLLLWLRENQKNTMQWPFDVVDTRIKHMLLDGKIDDEERVELFSLLHDIVGEKIVAENIASFSTVLPLTKPIPEIHFIDKKYCFTGRFCHGNRKKCERLILDFNGKVSDTVTKDLDYLVVGFVGSTDWIQSTHGRKIEKAVSWNINIISEEEWVKAFCF